ncbi:glycosyltransferase family 4 protein [Burkholderia ubonensis]|uniref:glycosyltransferase family 4 protein n=1 Tax=Burkholderia ubonensis TaxID=101571 RepID=UPI0009B3B26C|nr:glycosyltransferase family 4 protein [Burkholderia ubonensis]
MPFKVCSIYPWATFGGVERVLLNRAIAFRAAGADVQLSVFFLHDSGGIAPLREAIDTYKLHDYFRLTDSLVDQTYDLISLIDCPQAFDLAKRHSLKYVVECHTAYTNNRSYLTKLNSNCREVWVPSQLFADQVTKEVPSTVPVRVMRNFIPWDIESNLTDQRLRLTHWRRRPILFFGRMDAHKDPIALLDAFSMLEARRPGEFMLMLCGPTSPEIAIEEELHSRKIRQHAAILPPVKFSRASQLLITLAEAGGIFVSPSHGESFGLSAAEAIAFGMPVVLSDIEAHHALVDGRSNYLYSIGQATDLADKIIAIADDYETAASNLSPLRDKLSAHAFLEDWKGAIPNC